MRDVFRKGIVSSRMDTVSDIVKTKWRYDLIQAQLVSPSGLNCTQQRGYVRVGYSHGYMMNGCLTYEFYVSDKPKR